MVAAYSQPPTYSCAPAATHLRTPSGGSVGGTVSTHIRTPSGSSAGGVMATHLRTPSGSSASGVVATHLRTPSGSSANGAPPRTHMRTPSGSSTGQPHSPEVAPLQAYSPELTHLRIRSGDAHGVAPGHRSPELAHQRAKSGDVQAPSHDILLHKPAPENPECAHLDRRGDLVPEPELDPRSDLDGLLQYLEELDASGARITEVEYIINQWYWGGVVPLKHHGFVLRSAHGYFSLDFGRRGILWELFDTNPPFPEGTCFAKKYAVNCAIAELREYCAATKPWSLFSGNDCAAWSSGMLEVLKCKEDHVLDNGVNGACTPLPGAAVGC